MRMELPDFKEFKNYGRLDTVIVVGCGGTGGYVIGPLARMLQVYNASTIRQDVVLVLADGDAVEEKNLKRQHFIRADLGSNKAEVMASRYASALGMEIQAIPDYIESKDFIQRVVNLGRSHWSLRTILVIGCVDNNASRRVIHEWFRAGTSEKFWIDAGNEEESGQVICGYRPAQNKRFGRYPFSLPSVVEVYPELLEGDLKFNSELGCADLAESAPQNMMANVTAATLVLNFVQKLLYKEPLMSYGVSFGINNVFRSRLNTPAELNRVDPERRWSWDMAPALPEPELEPNATPKRKRKPKAKKESGK